MKPFLIALAGAPNAGKSTLFNRLTKGNQKVGNYPGVTVEKKWGHFLTPHGKSVRIVDLPGTYSLDVQSEDERIAVKTLFSNPLEPIDMVVVVVDATNLERGLGLVLDLKELGVRLCVSLNMMDLAQKRGLKLDLKQLSRELGCAVIPTVALNKSGVNDLLLQLESELLKERSAPNSLLSSLDAVDTLESVQTKLKKVDELLKKVTLSPTKADRVTHLLDKFLLHPVIGPLVLVFTLLLLFQAVFTWAAAPMDLIEQGIAALGNGVGGVLPDGYLKDLLVDGVISGVGSVLVFLPQILLLFTFILILEGTGYMARIAFLLNRGMAAVGLQGQAAVPLLSSFACAIPGIMACRTIKSPRERIITMMVAPLMTCSARLPVYTLLVGAFVPSSIAFWYFTWQGFAMFLLFISAIMSGMIVAWVLKKYAVKGKRAPFAMDLPTYKVPALGHILWSLKLRGQAFLKRAGTMILAISVMLWFLSTFPRPEEGVAPQDAIHTSFAGRMGHAIEPLVSPIGFDWRIAVGLVPGFAAREVMVSSLGTVFAIEKAEDEGLESLQQKLKETWGLPTAFALLAWYIFAPQCLATFAVLRRESNSKKWTMITFFYTLTLAYAAAWVAHVVTKWWIQ
jgi:ferrous iron transport protein B